ncbi:ACT domain-containing protein [Salsipaludibacter albus]|uniref:ACT domain-containing protein n=1 Tax=Salsipaludibacter albus TaxID=2849650 RepID=UPI001EE45930|nr:ACT domain-containing protein [Salsipaludibacter albus]MBY5163516.1 ACT domain-containing protein [Salsipaludibacter albus]
MRKDLVVTPDDRPGVLADIGETLAEAGVNIEACSAFTGGGKSVVHLLVDDDVAGVAALQEAGLTVHAAREVAIAQLSNEPGSLAQATRRVHDAGINIEQAYFANDNRIVIVSDDPAGVRSALGEV